MTTRTKANLKIAQKEYADMKARVDPAVRELIEAAMEWRLFQYSSPKKFGTARLMSAIDALVEATDGE